MAGRKSTPPEVKAAKLKALEELRAREAQQRKNNESQAETKDANVCTGAQARARTIPPQDAPLTDRMQQAIEVAMDALTPEKIKDQNACSIATTLAILIDKHQLLTGNPTEIVQHESETGADLLQKLRDKSKRVDLAVISESANND
jgi:hypothetical protein